MNIVDYVIIGIIGVSVLFGLYRGFIESVLGCGNCLVSFGASFLLYPKLAGAVKGNETILRTLMHYTDASSRIGDLELAVTDANSLSNQMIEQIVGKVNLPSPLDKLLANNLTGLSFGSSTMSVSDYVSQTILNASINIICFAVCFLLVFIAIQIIINVISHIAQFPVLKQLDALAGGGIGLIRGVLVCFVLFTLVPLVETIVPIDAITQLVADSTFAGFFNGGNLIMAIMNGKL